MPTTSFVLAHAEWLKAQATIAQINASSLQTDAPANFESEMNSAIDAKTTAEWKLIRTRAGDLSDIQCRAQVVAELFSEALVDGEPSDNRHQLMLSALIWEILNYWPPQPDLTA